VAFDLGIVSHGAYKLYIYGTPGSERFKVAMKVVSVGMHFGLLLVDATKGMTPQDLEILKELREKSVPYIVLANKVDMTDASIARVCEEAGMSCPVMPVSAKTGSGVSQTIDLIVSMVERWDRKAVSAML
jgi:signal recognition particle receptor subunit beta